jgi:hypothetical protein
LILGWAWCGLHKKRPGKSYAELVFLHLVVYTGHVVRFGVTGTRNVIELFLNLGRDRYGFDKKSDGTRYVKLVFFQPVDLHVT